MTHIEKMKEWLEVLEKSRMDFPANTQHRKAIASLRQAIAEAEGQEKALQALHAENERLGLYKDAYAEQGPAAWNRGVPPVHPQQKEGETFIVSYEATKPQRTEQEPVIDKSAAIRIATALGWEPKREWVGAGDLENSNAYLTPPQPEQEPVACIGTNGELMWLNKPRGIYSKPQPLYTTPPQRTWVGLTDLQKGVIKFNHSKVGMMLMTEYDLDAMLEATEQALKEKNT